jgi:hypothetical protein
MLTSQVIRTDSPYALKLEASARQMQEQQRRIRAEGYSMMWREARAREQAKVVVKDL